MHMSDALVSAPVAIVAGAAAASLIVIAGKRISRDTEPMLTPLMGVLGAFIFAAQMINFTIPGTGSSGHIVGGILLSAILGPWAAFLTIVSVLIIQCLMFADGGLMALGCNIINMGAFSCLVAYPLIFRPILRNTPTFARIMTASVTASVVALELGAFGVTAETELSGVTALPTAEFLMFMVPIHLAIGLCEGIATGAILWFVECYRPALLRCNNSVRPARRKLKGAIIAFAAAALILGGGFSWIASQNPDGLEWSIEKVAGTADLEIADPDVADAQKVQESTALLPDYDSRLSGIIGALLTILLLWSISTAIVKRHRKTEPDGTDEE